PRVPKMPRAVIPFFLRTPLFPLPLLPPVPLFPPLHPSELRQHFPIRRLGSAQNVIEVHVIEERPLLLDNERREGCAEAPGLEERDRKSTRLNSSHVAISYA